MRSSLLLTAALLSLAGCGSGGSKGPSVSPATASIPFVEFGSIFDWRADGADGIYIESDNRKWYHATFTAPCQTLPYTEHVDIHTSPPASVSRFDSIEVRGEDCYFKTFDPAPGPPASKPAKP